MVKNAGVHWCAVVDIPCFLLWESRPPSCCSIRPDLVLRKFVGLNTDESGSLQTTEIRLCWYNSAMDFYFTWGQSHKIYSSKIWCLVFLRESKTARWKEFQYYSLTFQQKVYSEQQGVRCSWSCRRWVGCSYKANCRWWRLNPNVCWLISLWFCWSMQKVV